MIKFSELNPFNKGFQVFKKQDVIVGKDPTAVVGTTNFLSLDGKVYNFDEITIETYDKMSKHYQIAAALAILTFSLEQINWYIESDDEEVKKVVTKSLQNVWGKLIKGCCKSFRYGYSPMAKIFTLQKIDGKDYIVLKKIKDLDPKDCTVKLNKSTGDFEGFFYKDGSPKGKLIDPKYCFWHTNEMENGNYYGKSMLSKVIKPWFFSEKVHTFANRYYERFGEPLVVGRTPIGTKTQDKDGKQKDAQAVMEELIAGIRSHTSVNLPSDKDKDGDYIYDLKYMESAMRGFDFNLYLDRLDVECSKGLLLPSLILSSGGSGSYSLGTTQIEVLYTNLMGIFNEMKDNIDKYTIDQIVKLNFDSSKSAKFKYQPLSNEVKTKTVDLITALINKDYAHPDLKELGERTGMILKEIEQPKEVVQKQETKKTVNKDLKTAKKLTIEYKNKAALLSKKAIELKELEAELALKEEKLRRDALDLEEDIDDFEQIKNG